MSAKSAVADMRKPENAAHAADLWPELMPKCSICFPKYACTSKIVDFSTLALLNPTVVPMFPDEVDYTFHPPA
jgi:hypothetical protein